MLVYGKAVLTPKSTRDEPSLTGHHGARDPTIPPKKREAYCTGPRTATSPICSILYYSYSTRTQTKEIYCRNSLYAVGDRPLDLGAARFAMSSG